MAPKINAIIPLPTVVPIVLDAPPVDVAAAAEDEAA